MNVLIIKDENDDEIKKYVDSVEDISKEIYGDKIKFYLEKISKTKIDIYVIISNDIEFIEKNFDSIKSKNSILIVTNKFEPKHILSCLLLSENLFSMRKGGEYILDKIDYVYNLTKEKVAIRRNAIKC